MRLDTPTLGRTAPVRTPGSTGPSAVPANAAANPSQPTVRPGRSVAVDIGPVAGTPFDAARVEEIRTAIADGSYPVDPHRTASALIAGKHLTDLQP